LLLSFHFKLEINKKAKRKLKKAKQKFERLEERDGFINSSFAAVSLKYSKHQQQNATPFVHRERHKFPSVWLAATALSGDAASQLCFIC